MSLRFLCAKNPGYENVPGVIFTLAEPDGGPFFHLHPALTLV